jgi:aspartate aminotransferase
MELSSRAQSIPPSLVFELNARVGALRRAGEDVIGLGAGQPDFPSPPEAVEAARAFLEGGQVDYTPASGIPELRTAAAQLLQRVSGAPYVAEQVVITNGAKEGLFLAMAALCDPGDEVLVPQPAWLSYAPMAQAADVVAVPVAGDPDRGFRITPEALDAAITDRTRALVLNSPSNPTGLVYSRAELLALATVLVTRDLSVISDEIYWPFVYEGSFCSMASLPGMAERTVVINGVSKSHSMTGWRIGFLGARPELAKACGSLKSHISSNAAAPSQHAALAALAAGDGHAEMMATAFRRRRTLALQALAEVPDVMLEAPAGAFYVFPRVDAYYAAEITGSVALCAALLEDMRLAVVPGAAFGEDRCLRISIAADDAVLADGLGRLTDFLAKLRTHVG